MAHDYFIIRDEKISGPYTEAQINSGVKSEKLKHTDLISSSKNGPWKPLFIKSDSEDLSASRDEVPPAYSDQDSASEQFVQTEPASVSQPYQPDESPASEKPIPFDDFIPDTISTSIVHTGQIPPVDASSIPERARSQLLEGEVVYHLMSGVFSQGDGQGCAIVPSEKRKSRNWIMITSQKIVSENQVLVSTRKNKNSPAKNVGEFELYTAYLGDVISIKAEVIRNSENLPTGCTTKENNNETHCLVVNLVNGSFSCRVNSLQSILDVQKTIMLLRQQGNFEMTNRGGDDYA